MRKMLGMEGDGTAEVLNNIKNKIKEFEKYQDQLQLDIKALKLSALAKRKANNEEGAVQDMKRQKLKSTQLATVASQIDKLETQKASVESAQF